MIKFSYLIDDKYFNFVPMQTLYSVLAKLADKHHEFINLFLSSFPVVNRFELYQAYKVGHNVIVTFDCHARHMKFLKRAVTEIN